MSDIVTESGLHIIITGESPNIDVIAVHGLDSNPAWTWCKEFKETEDSAKEGIGRLDKESGRRAVRWLSDLLPSVIPNARILVFNYPSAWLIQAPKEHLRSLSGRLLQAIHDIRAHEGDTKDRPILFIGHSFGGILIEDALVCSHHHRDPDLRHVASKTCGVVFLGTPLRGAKDASLATTMAYCTTALGSDPGLLKTLEAGSQELSNLLQNFCDVINEVCIRVVCFYETQTMSMLTLLRISIKNSLIVPEAHATIDGHMRLSLPANHSTINKYGSSRDECFLRVSSQLKAISDDAQRIVSQPNKDKREMRFFVLYSRNPAFTPRDVVAQEIDRLLSRRVVDEQTRIAIHGLGGAGKTQIALNLVYANKKVYDVYWVNGNSIESFMARYSTIAQLAQLTRGLNSNDTCLAVKQWLESEDSEDWLLCVDNADQLTDAYVESIQSYLPRFKGIILFTSRDGSIAGKLVHPEFCVELEAAMTKDEATTTFKSALGKSHFDEADIDQIVRLFDYLPLAIIQAAVYIREKSIRIDEYLDRLKRSEAKLLAVPLREMDQMARAVMTTWKVSYDYIRSQNALAADLLDVMSCLDFQDIQKMLIRSVAEGLTVNIDDINFDEAIGLLQSFALISPTASFSSYRLHRLVSLWTKQNIESKSEVFRTTLQIVSRTFEKYTVDKLLQYEALLPHVEAILHHTLAINKLERDRDMLLFKTANYYQDAEQWVKSERYYFECLSFRERSFGMEHPSTLDTVHNIAITYQQLGHSDEAREWSKWAIDGFEKAFGKEHPSTLDTVNIIANGYLGDDRFKEALEWSGRALAGYERAFGKEYLVTLKPLYGIADGYQKKDPYKEALEWYGWALVGREKALGKEHPSTLDTVNNIANGYSGEGRYEEALEWYGRALVGYERAFGKEHQATLKPVYGIANVYNRQGRYEEALEWYGRALAGYEKALGKEHPTTLKPVYGIATVYQEQGRYDEALDWYRQALAGYEKTLGEGHPSTLNAVHGIAKVYQEQGRLKEALEWYGRALVGRRKALNKKYPSTLDMVHNITTVYQE